MASGSAPLPAQKSRRMGTSSQLLSYCGTILTFVAQQHQDISKATRRSERILAIEERSKSQTNAKQQEVCFRYLLSLSMV